MSTSPSLKDPIKNPGMPLLKDIDTTLTTLPTASKDFVKNNIFNKITNTAPVSWQEKSATFILLCGAFIGVSCFVVGILIGLRVSDDKHKIYLQDKKKNIVNAAQKTTKNIVVESEEVMHILHFGIFSTKKQANDWASWLTKERYIEDVKIGRAILHGREEYIVYQGPFSKEKSIKQSNILGYNGIVSMIQNMPHFINDTTV